MICPLCAGSEASLYHRDRTRTYHRCWHCALVFVPPEVWLDGAAGEGALRPTSQ